MELCFDREFEFGVFAMGKWLRIACFPTSVFLIINVFPLLLEKRIEQLLHQSFEPTLSPRSGFSHHDVPTDWISSGGINKNKYYWISIDEHPWPELGNGK